MKTIKILSVLFAILLGATFVKAQDTGKPTIVFVHGIWADGSCWKDEIVALQTKGYNVVSVQNPVTSLAEDVATTKRAIDLKKVKLYWSAIPGVVS